MKGRVRCLNSSLSGVCRQDFLETQLSGPRILGQAAATPTGWMSNLAGRGREGKGRAWLSLLAFSNSCFTGLSELNEIISPKGSAQGQVPSRSSRSYPLLATPW